MHDGNNAGDNLEGGDKGLEEMTIQCLLNDSLQKVETKMGTVSPGLKHCDLERSFHCEVANLGSSPTLP
jgi:hypothetical protein